MSQISPVSPSEASRQGQGTARHAAKGQAGGHPLFAGLLEQAGLGLQADPGGLSLNPVMEPGLDSAASTGEEPSHDGDPALLDWSLLGLPPAPLQDPAPAPVADNGLSAMEDPALLETTEAPAQTLADPISSATPQLSQAAVAPASPTDSQPDPAPLRAQPNGLAMDPRPAWVQATPPTTVAAQASTADQEATGNTDGLTPAPAARPHQTGSPSASAEPPAPASTVSRARRSAVSIAALQHAQATSTARLDLQGWSMVPPGQSASAALQAGAGPAANTAPPIETTALPSDLGGGPFDSGPHNRENTPSGHQTGGAATQGEAPGLGAGTSATDNAAAPRGFALSLGRAMGDAFDHLGSQIGLWASQNMKRASLSLDTGLGKALDVDVSLQDGQAHLAFRTDDAAARAALQNHAQQVMADLLARNGLGLAGLSIGARGQDGQPGQEGERGGGQRTTRGIGSSTTEPETATVRWVARPGRALDVYA